MVVNDCNMMMDRKIMIVDDNPDDVEITKIALEYLGRQEKLIVASCGEAALNLLNENCLPSLILLDLKMAGMSGFDTLRQIRQNARLNSVPVAVVSSSALEVDKREAYEAGADSFVYKAFNIDHFGSTLKSLFEQYLPA